LSGGVPAGGYQRSATGGGQQIQNVQAGLWWPAADPGKLRAAAAAWRRLAADVEQVTAAASAVVRQVGAENHGQGITAFEAYWSSRWLGGSGCLPAVMEAARGLAQALDSYAEAVQRAQDRIKELIAAAATAAIIGIGLTVLTVGISDVAAGAVAGSLVAAAAAVGLELSAEAAAIIATGIVVVGMGALEGGLADLAIQTERVGYFHDQASIDWQEVLQNSAVGAVTAGATFGAGTAAEAAAPALGRIATRLGGGSGPRFGSADFGGPGAMKRLVYEASPKHGPVARGNVSAAPVNGQSALDMSFEIKATSTRRIGIDYEEGQFVIFDQTSEGVFHGHVRSWAQLDQVQRNVLIRLDLVDRRGNILVGPQ
jgi:hypothetical protein